MTTVEAPPTKAELAEAMTNLAATAKRMPCHWVERRAEIHRQIDAYLDLYLAAD